jgi:hypothetical protein
LAKTGSVANHGTGSRHAGIEKTATSLERSAHSLAFANSNKLAQLYLAK